MAPPSMSTALVAYLGGFLEVHVSTRVPATRPASWVRVQVTGGNRETIAGQSVFVLVEAWAPSDVGAEQLARTVWDLIDAADYGRMGGAGLVVVDDLSTPVAVPDPESASARWTFTARLLTELEAA